MTQKKGEVPFFGRFRPVRPGAIRASGHLLEFLRRQDEGLGSYFTESGYPFDTPMWAGGVGRLVTPSKWLNGEYQLLVPESRWWPYEQSAYLLGGLLKLGILLDDKSKIALFERNLDYLLDHADPKGRLGRCYEFSGSEWPMAVFFDAAATYVEYTGSARVRDAFCRHYHALTVDEIGRGFRHINNLEGVLASYAWSGDRALLDKAVEAYRLYDRDCEARCDRESLHWSRIARCDNAVMHGVSLSEELKLPVLLFLYTGERKWLDGAKRALDEILRRHAQIPGIISSVEYLAGRDPLQGYEMCVVHDFSRTLGLFLEATGDGEYADRIEKIFFNAFPGGLLKDFTGFQYLSSPDQLAATSDGNHSFFYFGEAPFRQYRPDHVPRCCAGNVHRVLPGFVNRLWMLDEASAPAAVLYGPSVFHGSFGGVDYTIEEETRYPYDESVLFRFRAQESWEMPLVLRIPGWCPAPKLVVNGAEQEIPALRAGFFRISRRWRDGDEVRLILPFEAVMRCDRYWNWFEAGPLVFSLPVEAVDRAKEHGRFAPRELAAVDLQNFAVSPDAGKRAKIVRTSETGFPLDAPPLRLEVPAVPVAEGSELELGRFTPPTPLFSRPVGGEQMIELIPYGATLLRRTAFADLAKREELPIRRVRVTESFPYDPGRPVAEQVFEPETASSDALENLSSPVLMNRDGYVDLLRHFGDVSDVVAYVVLQFQSDFDGEVKVALSIGDGGQCWMNQDPVGAVEAVSDAEFIAPGIFPARVARGINTLLVKAAEGPTPRQYRRGWGVRVRVYRELQ